MILNEQERQQRIKELTGKIIKVQIIGSIGPILFGLALYAIFGAQGDAFHPLLNDMDIVYSMLIISCVIMLWEVVTFIRLVMQRNALQKKE